MNDLFILTAAALTVAFIVAGAIEIAVRRAARKGGQP
jgi:hypothetical protein